jgi:hypothetical protein
LLSNDRETGDYIRTVSGQRLGKHVPAATVSHATGETGCRLRGPRGGFKKKQNWANYFAVGTQSEEYSSLARYQETSNHDTAGWKALK